MKIDRPRLPALTSLRFFAALHVCIFHLYAMRIASGGGWFHQVAAIGYVGVGFFFILSGFILVYTYADRDVPARVFWRARFARIYPAYLFSLLLAAPFFFYVVIKLRPTPVPFMVWPQNHLVPSIVLVLTLLQSWVPGAALAWNPPAWSLSDEAFFYLVFPTLLFWLTRKRKHTWVRIAVACWVVTLALTITYVCLRPDGVAFVDDNSSLTWITLLKFFPLVRFPEFLLGCCLALLYLRQPVDRKWGTPLFLFGVAYFAAAIITAPRIPYPILHDALLTPAFSAIIYGLALRPSWTRLFEFAPLVLLGDASYSFYLVHSNLLGMIFRPTGEPLNIAAWKIAIGTLVPVAASIAIYRFIETPARKKLRGKMKHQPEIAPAAATA